MVAQIQRAVNSEQETVKSEQGTVSREQLTSSLCVLVPIFRLKFCDIITEIITGCSAAW